MPLKRGYSRATQEYNFHLEKQKHPNMSNKQRTAIVLSTAARAAKKAGKSFPAPKRKRKG